MLIAKYGKPMVEDKYRQLLGSIIKFSPSIKRIKIFGCLLRLVKPNFDKNDMRVTLFIVDFLATLNIGLKCDNKDEDEV